MPYNFPSYTKSPIIPQSKPKLASISVPVPIGWLNVSVPSQHIETNEVADALNMWVNSEWRYSPFFWTTEFSTLLTPNWKIVEQYEYKKDENTTFHIVAFDDWTNLKLWYLDSFWIFTWIDSTLTTWDNIVFETYLNRYWNKLFPLTWITTATSWTASTLVDSGQSWTVNAYKWKILVITWWTWSWQVKVIEKNDATTIYTMTDFSTTPDATSTYEIREKAYSLFYLTPTLWLREWTSNSVKIISTAPTWNTMIIFKDFLFIWKDSTLYASYAFEPTNWNNAYFWTIGNQDWNDLTALANYKWNLIAFKKWSSINVIPQVDSTDWSLYVTQWEIDFTRWCQSQKTICSVDGELMVYDEAWAYIYWYADKIQVLWVQRRLSDKIYPEIIDKTIVSMDYDKRNDLVYLMATDGCYIYDWSRRALADWWHKLDLIISSLVLIEKTVYLWYYNEARVYSIDEITRMTWAYSLSKNFEMQSDFPKIFDFLKFSAKNVLGKIWLEAIMSSAHWVQVIRDASIDLHQVTWTWEWIGIFPIWLWPIWWVELDAPRELEFTKRRIPFPQFQASYLQIKWYNDVNSNFELENYSLNFEVLSTDHDPMSIYS